MRRLGVCCLLMLVVGRFVTAQNTVAPTPPMGWNSWDSFGTAVTERDIRANAAWMAEHLKAFGWHCIASRPYKSAEIAMIARAIAKTGRAMVLSLSPGEMPLDKVAEVRGEAAMWRISDDVWDVWHSGVSYPQGLGDQIPRLARWAGESSAGHWPDADMLPLGYLGPTPGWGAPRWTRLSHDEQHTLVTLWCMFQSPLLVGGDLPKTDPWTLGLLTKP